MGPLLSRRVGGGVTEALVLVWDRATVAEIAPTPLALGVVGMDLVGVVLRAIAVHLLGAMGTATPAILGVAQVGHSATPFKEAEGTVEVGEVVVATPDMGVVVLVE